jgi:hypothetical protein
MRRRWLGSLLIVMALCLVWSASAPLAQGHSGPETAASSKKWTPPRTPWGEPDLQGVWSYATLTPLERPSSQVGRKTLTDAEVAALDQEALTGADRRDGSADVDLARAYNAAWYDWGTSDGRTSLIVDPADGRLPPLTAEGQRRYPPGWSFLAGSGFDSYEDRPLPERCITYHGVPPLPSGYNSTYQIFQTPGYVAIVDENIHDVRRIPLDGTPHLDRKIRQWNGDSRGHWEGNSLVVETTNYSSKTVLRFPAGGETVRAVERFTRVAPRSIDYRFTITDPATYTRPWSATLPMVNLPEYVIYEYACHEGNYAIANALSGARAHDQAAGGKPR